MHPIFLQIGNFTIRSYGFMAMLGFLTGWLFIRLNRKHAGLTEDQASNLLLIATPPAKFRACSASTSSALT